MSLRAFLNEFEINSVKTYNTYISSASLKELKELILSKPIILFMKLILSKPIDS